MFWIFGFKSSVFVFKLLYLILQPFYNLRIINLNHFCIFVITICAILGGSLIATDGSLVLPQITGVDIRIWVCLVDYWCWISAYILVLILNLMLLILFLWIFQRRGMLVLIFLINKTRREKSSCWVKRLSPILNWRILKRFLLLKASLLKLLTINFIGIISRWERRHV